LADDHVLIRHGLKNIINKNASLLVEGEVSNGKELMAFLVNHEVDLVILDISMPEIGGMEAVSLIKQKYPLVKILMLTMHKNKQYFYDAMAAGADGYLMKDDPDDQLQLALEKILSGKSYITPYMVEDFADDVISMYRDKKKSPLQKLTKREKEILQLLVDGHTSKIMAVRLKLSQRTIDHYRSSLLRKFNKKNSAELVQYAVRNGLVAPVNE
jgi:DNA-binding NarL/FixJ family response regulator